MSVRYQLIAVILIGLTASVFAQQAAPPSPAALLLRHRSEIRLSTSQIRRLEALDKSYVLEVRPVEARILQTRASERRVRSRGVELTEKEQEAMSADRIAIRRDLRRLQAIRDANWDEAWRILTPMQRARAEDLVREGARGRRGERAIGRGRAGSDSVDSRIERWLRQ